MAFFKLIFLLQCVGLVQLSSSDGANSFSRCNHTDIIKTYTQLLQKYITSLIMATSEFHPERDNVIDCCPKPEGREALLSCIYNFTGVCIASHYPNIWKHTVNLLEASCSDYVRPNPKIDVWNATVTHRNSEKCKDQRRKIIANQECGNHILQELKMMWISYIFE